MLSRRAFRLRVPFAPARGRSSNSRIIGALHTALAEIAASTSYRTDCVLRSVRPKPRACVQSESRCQQAIRRRTNLSPAPQTLVVNPQRGRTLSIHPLNETSASDPKPWRRQRLTKRVLHASRNVVPGSSTESSSLDPVRGSAHCGRQRQRAVYRMGIHTGSSWSCRLR